MSCLKKCGMRKWKIKFCSAMGSSVEFGVSRVWGGVCKCGVIDRSSRGVGSKVWGLA